MESFEDLLVNRRSVRRYDSKKIEKEKIDSMLEAVLLSPTSKGIPSRNVIVVDDGATISSLSQCKPHGSDFLAGAPLALVISGDTENSAAWIEDTSIAAITLQYSAEALGLSSCWIQVRGRQSPDGGWASDYVKSLLNIPEGYEVEVIVAVGYPGERMEPHSLEELNREAVRYNSFSSAYFEKE